MYNFVCVLKKNSSADEIGREKDKKIEPANARILLVTGTCISIQK